MKYISLFLAGMIFLALSCSENSKDSQFKTLKYNKGYYKVIKGGEEGHRAKPGEYILYNILFKDNKGKIFKQNTDKDKTLREHVIRDTAFMKDLTAVSEVLYTMTKGDSAFLYIPLSEDERVGDMKNSDTLLFYINVRDIISEEKMRDIIEDEFLKQEAEETAARIKQIEVDQKIMKARDEYQKGLLKGKLKRTKNGVEIYILEPGKGRAIQKGDRISVGYYGMLMKDATPFDNSFRRDKDFEMVVGAQQVIPGWDEAFVNMHEGDKGVIFVPSKMAFGEKGKAPIIPPNADLVFYVEIHKILN